MKAANGGRDGAGSGVEAADRIGLFARAAKMRDNPIAIRRIKVLRLNKVEFGQCREKDALHFNASALASRRDFTSAQS